ncbi:B12-binding domain-containing protein [Tautonia plasticadhaerens]|uniref:Helix-turn-helix domain protein n=1 Tax=Tautonia plasticadhaerens TaxID=2527974 RepID=A0A518GVZ7_9BACT|nr:B12-binding domain-containing protein [Tautonia plasticadhaerens]QDV32738.1 Helix-turn-helix domain protein [Tautonia plasticadhaerens]
MKSFKTFIRNRATRLVQVVDTLLKTRQLAGLLNVSVSTIKRWVDLGELPATRTVGGHRLVPLSGALRFAAERGLPTDRLERFLADSASATATPGEGAGPVTWEDLATALKRGRSAAARNLILRAYASSHDAAALADDLIRPSMESIGHDWERRSLDIYQEHRASRIVEGALMELLRSRTPPPVGSPVAIGASPQGDLYTLPGLLAELTLRELGWDAVNLGPNLPMASLARAIRVQQPKLVWLSVCHLGDESLFIQEYKSFYASASRTGAAVVLGGSALTPALRASLVAASFGDRMAHLREFARRISPTDAGSPDTSSMERPGTIEP